MKRNPKPLMKYYMPLVLWREDLDEITSILQRREAGIQFEADDYSFENLEELETHLGSKDKNELKITSTSTKPYVSIGLENRRAWTYVGAESPDASGVYFELDKVLTARQRRFRAKNEAIKSGETPKAWKKKNGSDATTFRATSACSSRWQPLDAISKVLGETRRHRNDRAAPLEPEQAAHSRSATAKPLHATLARRALRLDTMAAPPRLSASTCR